MKVSPLAQGTGVPAQSPVSQTTGPARLERAKAIASGEAPPEQSGDMQADRAQASINRIRMQTQRSTNRHEQPMTEEQHVVEDIPQPDTNELAQETEDTRPLSPQFAALARQKRALQIERADIAKQRAELEQKASVNSEEYVSKAELLANPLKVFEAGVTYDQLTEAILNNQSTPVDPQKLRNEIKEDLLKELNGQFLTRDQQAEQQVLNDIRREVLSMTADGDDFEAIRDERAQDQVVKLVHKVYKEGWDEMNFPPGYVLDTREAAQIVEDYFIDESFRKASGYKKVQSRLTPAQEAKASQIQAPKPGTKIMRTLTNRDSASPVMDKRARAIAAMQGTLKRG